MKLKPLTLGISFALAGVAVIAAVVWAFMLAPAEDAAVRYTPRDAALYVNVFLDPSNGQKMALRDLFESFPIEEEEEDLLEAIEPLVDRALDDIGLEFGADVRPWLGSQVALFMTEFSPEASGAMLIATKDGAASMDAVEKIRENEGGEAEAATYNEVDYRLSDPSDAATGVVGDFLVVGTNNAFKAVVDAFQEEDSLESSQVFETTTDNLPEDRLALFYVDLRRVLAGPQGGLIGLASSQVFPSFVPAASALYASPNGIVIESVAQVRDDEAALRRVNRTVGKHGLLLEMPAGAWMALGLPNFAETFRSLFLGSAASGVPGLTPEVIIEQFRAQTGIDLQQDLLSWMGDAGLFVSGTNRGDVQGAVVIESSDPRKTVEVIARIGGLLLESGEDVGFYPARALYEGFVVRQPPDRSREPIYVVYDEVNERAIITYGQEARLEAVSPDLISNTDGFKRATSDLGDDYKATAYVNVGTAVGLLRNFGVLSPDAYEDAEPWIAPISHITIGSKLVRDNVLQRVVVGITEPSDGS